ncbi:hypothetical protein QR680_009253 [Steinernema hermaphroditum]|uniref:Probable deoxycytidylate deaminase n=1 Tax=Steinernema hermaphroditum TaxID=289476 RepID=A0AA39IJM5_9BILA|nr:hypothetical protein QR680_009253 [Steinernema hermaphroditum]
MANYLQRQSSWTCGMNMASGAKTRVECRLLIRTFEMIAMARSSECPSVAFPMAPEPTSPEMDLAFRSRTNVSSKRSDYISWDEYFMSVALLASQRSKDPVTQVGAAIVTDKVIVGVGYNGMPRGCDDDDMPWGKTAEDPLENKYLYVCHAEMNAILNKNSESVRGSTIYCTLFPCCSCAKYIIQAGINRVVYLKDKPNNKEMIAAKLMFEKSGVQYSQFAPTKRKLVLDFGKLSIDISTSPSTTSSGLSSV